MLTPCFLECLRGLVGGIVCNLLRLPSSEWKPDKNNSSAQPVDTLLRH